VEEVRDHEADHRVPQELERLVVPAPAGLVLVGPAAVGERAVQEVEVGEAIAEPLLERVKLLLARLLHEATPP
jgi:hypothetical protein